MNFFLKKLTKRDNKLKRIDSALETSFHGVKKDVSKIFEWLSYLYHRNQFQDRVIHELQAQLHQIPKTQEELKELIDEHYALTPLKDKVKKLSAKVDSLDDTHSTITSLKYKLEDIKAKLDPLDAQSDQINNMVSKISKITRKIEEMEDNNHPLRKHVEEHHSRLERL